MGWVELGAMGMGRGVEVQHGTVRCTTTLCGVVQHGAAVWCGVVWCGVV